MSSSLRGLTSTPAEFPPQFVPDRAIPIQLAPRLGQRPPQPAERSVRQLAIRLAQLALERRLGRLDRGDDGFRGGSRAEVGRRFEGRRELDVACFGFVFVRAQGWSEGHAQSRVEVWGHFRKTHLARSSEC